jgi:ribosomal protein S18 acetylase RimI-like enzyme
MKSFISRPSENQVISRLPAIPELLFRNFQGESDFPGLQTVLNAARMADHEERFDTPEQFIKNMTSLCNCDIYQDLWIAQIRHEIVAYSKVEWWVDAATEKRIYLLSGVVRPDWRGHGLGRALLQRNQQRAMDLAQSTKNASTPSNAGDLFESHANSFQPRHQALLEQAGFTVVREGYSMRRPNLENIPDLPLPEGLEIRPARPEQYRQIWEASQEAFRDHWGYAEPGEESYQNWLHSYEFQPDLWQVAWDGNEVAGMILNFINQSDNEKFGRKRGYTEGISVRRPWRKRGLARALLARSLEMHRSLGMTETALGVDASNPHGAVHLYQSMGYEIWRTNFIYQKAMPEHL